MTVDGVWVGNRIYWTPGLTPKTYITLTLTSALFCMFMSLNYLVDIAVSRMNFPVANSSCNVLSTVFTCFYKFNAASDMYSISCPVKYDVFEHPVEGCRSPVLNNALPTSPLCVCGRRWP
jgi:hypothetical protein